MSRSKVGVASEGMVPAQKEGEAAEAVDSTMDIVSMLKTMVDEVRQLTSRMDRLEMKVHHPTGNAGVEEVSFERSEPAAENGVVRNIPHDGTHTLPPRPDKEQRSTGLHEEEQDQVPASRPSESNEKEANPGGEFIREGLVQNFEPSNPFVTISSNLVTIPHIGQSVSRSDEPTLRDPLHSESLNGEPVLRSTGFDDGETPVNQEEATPTSPNIQEGLSISSQVVAVCTTGSKKYGTVRHQPVLRNQTAIKNAEENKFFDPGGKQVIRALPPRQVPLSGRA